MRLGRAILLFLGLAAGALAQYGPTAAPTLTLSMASSSYAGTPMNITWNPIYQQYYGGGGGNSSYMGFVWNASGAQVQALNPIGTDLRAFYFNPANSQMYAVGYNAVSNAAAYTTVGLTPTTGLLSGSYTSLSYALFSLPNNQVVPAYDPNHNLLYALYGSSVNVVNPADGSLVRTLTLAVGSNTIYSYAIGYDPANDALIEVSNTGTMHALAFSASTGALLASIALPGLTSPDMSYGLGFTNNQLFVYDSSISSYRGYSLVPEPGTTLLLGLGLAGLALWQWRRRRAA